MWDVSPTRCRTSRSPSGWIGGVLASAGRRADARVHLERALALDPDYTPAPENLARLAAVQGH